MPAPLHVDLADHRRSYVLPATVHSTIPRRPRPGEIGAHWVARGLLVETAAALHATPHRLTYREQPAHGGPHLDAPREAVSIAALLTLPGPGGPPIPLDIALEYGIDATGRDFWRLTVDGVVPTDGSGTHLPSPAVLGRVVQLHREEIASRPSTDGAGDPAVDGDRDGITGAPSPGTASAGRTVRAPSPEGGEDAMISADATVAPAPAVAVYAELPPHDDAHAAVAAVINVALAAERGRQDLSEVFRLLPVAVEETSAAGRPYLVLRWGVFVPDPDYADLGGPHGDLVSYGALRRRRDGQLRYDARGLHEPLDVLQLRRLLTAAGRPEGLRLTVHPSASRAAR